MATIQNVVSTCKISQNYINLHDIPEKIKNSHYNPTKFNEAIIKLHEPKATILLFSSGRFVCTGTKNIYAITKWLVKTFAVCWVLRVFLNIKYIML